MLTNWIKQLLEKALPKNPRNNPWPYIHSLLFLQPKSFDFSVNFMRTAFLPGLLHINFKSIIQEKLLGAKSCRNHCIGLSMIEGVDSDFFVCEKDKGFFPVCYFENPIAHLAWIVIVLLSQWAKLLWARCRYYQKGKSTKWGWMWIRLPNYLCFVCLFLWGDLGKGRIFL